MVDMKMEDFLVDLTAKDDCNRVQELIVQISGKCERQQAQGPVHLSLVRYDSHPMLCPLRALFIFLSRTGIRSGYLFCTKEELSSIEDSGRLNRIRQK